ncbi:MAG: Capsular exopolysaccharide family [Chloroflexi bacterium]|nr:Capsular exopolysaccharide family [Chloroflexota bacterium]
MVELRDYLVILRRHRLVIMVTTAVAVLAAILVTLIMEPQYAASTTLRVMTAATGAPSYLSYDLNYSDRLMNTYSQIATSEPTVMELAQKLGVAKPPTVEATIIANTELMQFTVGAPKPELAARGANILATMLIAQMKQDERSRGIVGRQASAISVVAQAVAPQSPRTPRKAVNIGLGLLLGLVGGIGLALLFQTRQTIPYDGSVH